METFLLREDIVKRKNIWMKKEEHHHKKMIFFLWIKN